MLQARREEQWDHTAFLAAAILNTVSKRRVSPAKLHPYRRRAAPITVTRDITVLDSLCRR